MSSATHGSDLETYTWNDGEHALLVGQLTPDPNGNGKEAVKEAWLRYTVKLQAYSTIENYKFQLKAHVIGSDLKKVDLNYLPEGIPRVKGAWEPVCEQLWKERYAGYIKDMQALRLSALQVGKPGKKSKEDKVVKTQTQKRTMPFVRSESIEAEMLNVSKEVSTDKLQEFALYIQKLTQIKKAPSAETVRQMRTWSDLVNMNMFKCPKWVGFLKSIRQYPSPQPPCGTKRQRETVVIGVVEEGEEPKRVKLAKPAMESYTAITGVQRVRACRALVEVDRAWRQEIVEISQRLRELRQHLPSQ